MENTLQKEIDLMAKAIKTDNYPMSIGELSNLYQDGDLKINPIYQRMFRWDIAQQSALIESILLNIPIPPIYVYQNENGKWNLIDGQQRLSTIFKFMGILKKESKKKEITNIDYILDKVLDDDIKRLCLEYIYSHNEKYYEELYQEYSYKSENPIKKYISYFNRQRDSS